MTVFEELKRRGLIAQMSHPEEIEKRLNEGPVTFYIGFDATADSLHVGHFLQLVVISHLQKAGHNPILLLGTGTTLVGDPSGKSDMRKMLTSEQIEHNAECFRKQMSRFVDFSDGKATIARNGDWLLKLNYIDLLRDIGVHFTVNRMLAAECFKSRLVNGLSFLEFNYMIMQSYDFLHLFREFGCELQLGGDDQWSNILNGADLIRRVEHKDAFAMTFTLLTTKEGKKMGKTEKGALWLDSEKTSPYEFFQYWRNIDDADVINCMKMITFVPIEEIEAMENLQGSELNSAKERLAFELTKMVHGEDEAKKALEAAKSLFAMGSISENIPSTFISKDDFMDGEITVIDLLVKTGLAPSKAEARRLIIQGGITVDDAKIEDIAGVIKLCDFKENSVIIKKGKKSFNKVVVQ